MSRLDYIDGLYRAIEIIQGEEYPLSYGLVRVKSMVDDILEEIESQERRWDD